MVADKKSDVTERSPQQTNLSDIKMHSVKQESLEAISSGVGDQTIPVATTANIQAKNSSIEKVIITNNENNAV